MLTRLDIYGMIPLERSNKYCSFKTDEATSKSSRGDAWSFVIYGRWIMLKPPCRRLAGDQLADQDTEPSARWPLSPIFPVPFLGRCSSSGLSFWF